jgi:hypothetical protein
VSSRVYDDAPPLSERKRPYTPLTTPAANSAGTLLPGAGAPTAMDHAWLIPPDRPVAVLP